MINIKNRVPAEVFLWHPQQRQLHGNTPIKQRQSRNFKSLNIITSTKFETVDLVTAYSEVNINVQTAVPLLGHRGRPEASSPFVGHVRRLSFCVVRHRRSSRRTTGRPTAPTSTLSTTAFGAVYSIMYTRSR